MTLTIELTAEEEARLQAAARQQGIAPADVVISLVRNLPDEEVADAESKTWGAKVIEQWRRDGVVGLFTDRPGDALEVAHNLRDEQQRSRYREPMSAQDEL